MRGIGGTHGPLLACLAHREPGPSTREAELPGRDPLGRLISALGPSGRGAASEHRQAIAELMQGSQVMRHEPRAAAPVAMRGEKVILDGGYRRIQIVALTSTRV